MGKKLGQASEFVKKKSAVMAFKAKIWAKQKEDRHNEVQDILDNMDEYPIEQQIAAVYYERNTSNNPLVGCFCSPNAEAEDALRENLDGAIEDATRALDTKDLWGTWMNLYSLMREAEALGYVGLPSYEAARDQADALGLSMDDQMDLDKIRVTDPQALACIQSLFDTCSLDSVAGVALPRMRVTSAYQVYHEKTKAEYLLMRQKLVEQLDGQRYPRVSVPSQQVSLASLFRGRQPVDPNYNEYYLFHGTSEGTANIITDTDFLIKTAADNGWTFGKGVYAAEWASHAQLFAMMGNEKEGYDSNSVTILVCRCFCGKVQEAGNHPNTGTPASNKSSLEYNIKSGAYNSTRGSEIPDGGYQCHDFILPDDDQILPEFIVNLSW